MYDREDPRRAERIAELYDVPRLKRPFWVAEQVETAIFDGLGPRIRWALTGRVILRWKLRSGVRQNRLHPTSFWIPSEEDKDEIEPGVNTSSTSTPIHTRRPWRGHTTLSARSAARATRRTLSQASQPGTGTR